MRKKRDIAVQWGFKDPLPPTMRRLREWGVANALFSPAQERWFLGALEVADEYALAGVPFMTMQPSAILSEVRSLELYLAHCRELHRRWKRGEDLRPGTWAEIAALSMQASLRAPLNTLGSAVYAQAFLYVMRHRIDVSRPDMVTLMKEAEEMAAKEPYVGAIDEEVRELRKRLAVKERKAA